MLRVQSPDRIEPAVRRVDVNDDQPRHGTGSNADVRVGPPSPPLTDGRRIRRRVVEPTPCPGMFAGRGAVDLPARAAASGGGVAREDDPALLELATWPRPRYDDAINGPGHAKEGESLGCDATKRTSRVAGGTGRRGRRQVAGLGRSRIVGGVDSLASLVEQEVRRYRAEVTVEQAVFGTADPGELATLVENWCREHLGTVVIDAWLWRASVGCVAGVRLADGRDVVVKVYPPERSARRLAAVLDAQRHAVSAGIPGSVPITGPHRLGLGHATAETSLRSGRRPVLTRDPDRRTAAEGWWRLRCVFDGMEHLVLSQDVQSAETGLYPRPHSPLFDFEATADGAEWIDALACDARAVMDRHVSRPVVVHSDWRADNIRVSADGTALVAVYDWDSLRVEREAVAVGQVAAMHAVDWSGPDDPYFATAAECIEFVRAVEVARGDAFTAQDWTAAKASILFGWCYTARCEHARAMVGADDARFGMRARLTAQGATLLT